MNDKTQKNLLPTSPVLGSFVIISWLLFTPSAWRRYVASIDPDLPSDFALADLKSYHWYHKAVLSLLFLGHVLWSVWVSTFVILCLWLLNAPGEVMVFASCYAFSFTLIGGILGSLTVSVAFGIINR